MTQQYSQKYTVVCFFEPQAKASNFSASEWPLHVTLLDTFKTNWPLPTLGDQLRGAVLSVASFETIPTTAASLGENKDVRVKLLPLDGGLSTLHARLMELAAAGSFVFNTPAFVGKGFLPHVTDQANNKVEIGTAYGLVSISLVDMFPDNNHLRRAVIDTYNFKDQP